MMDLMWIVVTTLFGFGGGLWMGARLEADRWIESADQPYRMERGGELFKVNRVGM